MEIPVYLLTGFLFSGKTTFINGMLEEGFCREERTLLISCEEGEVEYNTNALDNVTLVQIENEEDLTTQLMLDLEEKYRPQQIIIEFNGMWSLERLCTQVVPEHQIIYQILTFVEAETFEPYVKNIGQLMMEKIMNADMLIFNRCTPQLAEALRGRNLRMVNRQADIFLEYEDGSNEPYMNDDECPFDLESDTVEIADDDYGLWYVDVMDHPERWEGKTVHMKLIMAHSTRYEGAHCPGRFAMVCCEDDIQFLGLLAKGDNLEQYENRQWLEVTATMANEYHEAYEGDGPVMHFISAASCDAPEKDVVYF